ncbi:MAG: putative ABC-type nitrate/sulfonate/bicarbonate transport system periplasmic component [Hyphomicrobiales bacterium]|nr:putative ABC-type nitrate/sulfonate/bicarbonate transport system periplasmic component [Hyphomicrobiales bacterium]
MKIAIPDLISNSYFPAVAAVDLGFFKAEGLDVELELIFPVNRTLEVLRDGGIDFVGGSAHSVPFAFPEWKGGKLLGSLAQNMYWFLVLRKDLKARKGDINAIRGLSIGAAPLVDLGLKRLLTESGIDPDTEVKIGPVPGAFLGENKNFGVAAAKALGAGMIDGFWANGMGAEVAVRSGFGDIIIDARRGDGPPKALHYTMPALITSDAVIARDPQAVEAAVRALVKTQKALRADVSLATEVGRKRFPEAEAALIADVVARDLPFYTADITPEFVDGMTEFQRHMGLIKGHVAYEDIVAVQYAHLWKE